MQVIRRMKGQPNNSNSSSNSSNETPPPPPSNHSSPSNSLIENIPHEVLLSILNYIPALNLLHSVSLTSHQFHCAIHDDLLWQLRLKALVKPSFLTSLKDLNLHQRQRSSLFIEAHYHGIVDKSGGENSNDGGAVPGIATPKSLLVPQETALQLYTQQKRVALSTTTDNEEERIENVLPSSNDNDSNTNTLQRNRWWSQLGTYWSSAPCPIGDPGYSDEVLLFTTSCPNALIAEVSIKPFTEVEFLRRQTYTWYGTIISVYRILEETDKGVHEENHNNVATKNMVGFPCVIPDDTPHNVAVPPPDEFSTRPVFFQQLVAPHEPKSNLIQTFLSSKSCQLIYQSQQYNHESEWNDEVQTYKVPPGIMGNVITITLVGKNFRQFPTSGFYNCVDQVEVKGVPLLKYVREVKDLEDLEVQSWFR